MNPQHRIQELPVLVLLPHNRCNCRCVMCDIWRIREVREITQRDLEPHLASLSALKVKWIVFSGGEPLMHSDLPSLCRFCRQQGIRLTLLTAGLLLDRHAESVAEWMDDVIVSIDGPPEVHDRIRAVPGAYRKLQQGVDTLRRLRADMPVHGRCTVQKENYCDLRNTVQIAHELNLNSLSFLAADVTSTAFNRTERWPVGRQDGIALGVSEVDALELEVEALIDGYQADIESGFVVERPDKLRRLVLHFRAHLGQTEAVAPRCNAPWVSSVIGADGTVRPCFFHDPIGNIHDRSLADVLNSDEAIKFRQNLNVSSNPICRSCVCSLFLETKASEAQTL